jgi:segregation and condensation protein A
MEENRILELLTKDDNITWKAIIYDLVKSENMNPWDIDVSLLTKKYIDIIRKLEQMNFRVSGKVVLAAAILVRLKSSVLIGKDIAELDSLFASAAPDDAGDMAADDFYSGLEGEFANTGNSEETPTLSPRTPQPRKRKVSMYDLIGALQKALEVKQRRIFRNPTPEMHLPDRKIDIALLMNNVYSKIQQIIMGTKKPKVKFSEITSQKKQDKIDTFVPLLHLASQQKLDLSQQAHFGEIEISLYNAAARKAAEIELDRIELAEKEKKGAKPKKAKSPVKNPVPA